MTTNALTLLPLASRTLIAEVQATSEALGQVVEILPLTTTEDEAKARDLLQAIAALTKRAEESRKADKAPHLAACREVDGAYTAATADLARVEALLRRRIGEAAVARETARQAAVKAAQEAAQARDMEAANAAISEANAIVAVAPPPAASGVSERFTWEVETVTISEVPREYLAIDLVKVKAEIKAADRDGRTPAIPGVTFRRVASVVVRGAR